MSDFSAEETSKSLDAMGAGAFNSRGDDNSDNEVNNPLKKDFSRQATTVQTPTWDMDAASRESSCCGSAMPYMIGHSDCDKEKQEDMEDCD